MALERINEATLRRLQGKYGLQFCRSKGTDVANICKNKSTRFGIIGIDGFLAASKKGRPAVYRRERDFLRIMKR